MDQDNNSIANPTAKATPTGLLDLEQSNMRPRENQEYNSENRPPLGSLIIALAYSVITVASFTIVIPTSDSYITSFGGSSTMAGLLVGITPIFSAFAQPFMSFFFKRYKYRSILIVCCLVNIIGCVLYALGSATNWIGTILIGRIISGIVGGPSYSATYVSRTTDQTTRSLYMQYMTVSIGIGYGIGPLLGAAVTEVCNIAGWNSDLVNENTTPGWLMAILFVIEAILLTFFMVEPPRDTDTKRSLVVINDDVDVDNDNDNNNSEASEAIEIPAKPPSIPWTRVLLTFVVVVIVPLNVGALEVHTVLIAEKFWGFSSEYSGIYLGCINLLAVPFGLIPVASYVQDNKGMLFGATLLLAINPMFWDYGLETVSASATLFGFGALLLLISAQFLKAFSWGLVSKLPHPSLRPDVICWNTVVYMLGRGIGAIVSSFITSYFGMYLLCLDAFLFLYIGVSFRWLTTLD